MTELSKITVSISFLIVMTISCTTKLLEEPDCNTQVSYQMDIKPITDSSCALTGCHVTGFVNGDYTSYAGLKEKVDKGVLLTRVAVQRSMPPPNTPGPEELTVDQIELISCWVMQGAPDN